MTTTRNLQSAADTQSRPFRLPRTSGRRRRRLRSQLRSIFVREGILEKPVGVASAPKPKAKDAGAEQPASDVATEDAAGNGDAPAESSGTKAEAAE